VLNSHDLQGACVPTNESTPLVFRKERYHRKRLKQACELEAAPYPFKIILLKLQCLLTLGHAGKLPNFAAHRQSFSLDGQYDTTTTLKPHFHMIHHTVVFQLKHSADSAEERDFLHAACELASIPGVTQFECLRQVSSKNPFTFGLSMKFADEAAHRLYQDHPLHTRFVQERWLKEVVEFMEIDYEPIL